MPFLILLLLIAFVIFVSLETLIKLFIILALVGIFAKAMHCFSERGDFEGWENRWDRRHPDDHKPKRSPYV